MLQRKNNRIQKSNNELKERIKPIQEVFSANFYLIHSVKLGTD